VAGGRPSEGPLKVHSNVLEGHGGGERGERRTPRQGAYPLSCTAVALTNEGNDVRRHAHPVVVPPHCRVHAGLPGVPREGRVVLEVKDLLLQGGRDHPLVSAVGGRAAVEDPIGVLKERDVPSSAQGLHDLLAVAVRGLGG